MFAEKPHARSTGGHLRGIALMIAIAVPPIGADGPGPVPASRPIAKIEDYAPPEEFVLAGGIKTHFVSRGAGRPIVFIHGFGSCTYTWRRNLDAIAAKGFRAVAVDVKGFGLSAKPKDGQYHIASYTAHLLSFLDAMGLDRPILVGNSMGGAIAARSALLRPDRVGGVVLVDAAPLDFGLRGRDAKSTSALTARLRAALARTLITREAIAAGLRGAYHDPKYVTDEAIEVYHRPLFIEGAAEALVAMADPPGEVADANPLPPLRTLKVPALIVWGRHDRVIPVATAEAFAKQLPSARVLILEASGHMPHEEEPEAFNAAVAAFATMPPTRTPM